MEWNKLLSPERIRKSSMNNLDIRNEFESDFGRIIFSPALRRMHDKTQVFPLTTDDNIHSRLTHSNEVMSIGYTFGLKLCKSDAIKNKTKKQEVELLRILPVILKNICLIHDIGNAPFGHFGETIISNYFKKLETIQNHPFNTLDARQKRDFTDYDGNAQGLRVLCKLQILEDIFGLNLTYATLAAYLKYPNFEVVDKSRIETGKHGVFFSEQNFFDNIIDTCGLKVNGKIYRHPLCYLMEAADSIAYSVMDIEDGFNSGLLTINDIYEIFKGKSDQTSEQICSICTDHEKKENTKIVEIRICLISYLVNKAFSNFESNIEKIENGQYNKELINDDDCHIGEGLSKICSTKIFSSRNINYLETAGYSVFVGLLDFYIEFLFHEDKKFRRRAKSLISKSIIDCAILENLKDVANRILNTRTDIDKKEIKDKVQKHQSLVQKQYKTILEKEEYKELKELKKEIYDILKPDFDHLDNYSKFRVIVDFISGMTDQYALNHFQKISGQRIN